MDADSSTVLQQKATRLLLLKDAADRDLLPSGRRFDHFTAILDQLRRATSSERGRQVGRSVGRFGASTALSTPITISISLVLFFSPLSVILVFH